MKIESPPSLMQAADCVRFAVSIQDVCTTYKSALTFEVSCWLQSQSLERLRSLLKPAMQRERSIHAAARREGPCR